MEVLRLIEPTSPQKGPQKMDHPLPSASSLHLQSPLQEMTSPVIDFLQDSGKARFFLKRKWTLPTSSHKPASLLLQTCCVRDNSFIRAKCWCQGLIFPCQMSKAGSAPWATQLTLSKTEERVCRLIAPAPEPGPRAPRPQGGLPPGEVSHPPAPVTGAWVGPHAKIKCISIQETREKNELLAEFGASGHQPIG